MIVYSREQLLSYRPDHAQVDGKAVKQIRLLRINKRKRGKRGGRKNRWKENKGKSFSSGVNFNNLQQIKLYTNKSIKPSNTSNLRVMLCNVQSLKSKEDIISKHIRDEKIELTLTTETWLKNDDTEWIQSSEFYKDPFKISTAHREGKRGGGIALIYKNNIQVNKVNEGQLASFQYCIWKILSNKLQWTLIGVYRPPYSTTCPVTNAMFLNEYTVWLADLLPSYNKVVIMGDFNLDVLDEVGDPVTFIDINGALGMKQLVTFPTHRSGSALDHIFTDVNSSVLLENITPTIFTSDHRAVQATLITPRQTVTSDTIQSRNKKDLDLNELSNMIPVNELLVCNDLQVLVKKFEDVMKEAYDKLAPITEKRVINRPRKLWFNKEVREQKRIVRRREAIFKRYRENHQWIAYKVELKKYKQMLRHQKISFYSTEVANCGKDTKKLYQLLNRLTGRTKDNPLPSHNNSSELAEEFANFFLNKIHKIREALDKHNLYCPPTRNISETFEKFKIVTEEKVLKVINGMATKSCELDPIPVDIFKQILPVVVPVVTKIINMSLQQGEFIESWKMAIVRPLLKKLGMALVSTSYRPVSNLNFLSKVLEKCMLQQFVEHCDTQNLFPDYQSAYRSKYSCETALCRLMDDILWNMETGKVTCLVAMDLSAAFDTVHHGLLLDVLHNYFGVRGVPLEWVKSYLCNRQFKVCISGNYSNLHTFNFSVPQGSCAGPVFYLNYASTLETIISEENSIYGYADDHAITDTFTAHVHNKQDEESCTSRLESSMCEIKSWMDENRLKMNTSKTEFILFGSRQQLTKTTLSSLNVADETVEGASFIKYLGAFLDNNLSMKKHISNICAKATANIVKIKAIRSFLTNKTAKTLMVGLVLSHLDANNGILIELPDTQLRRLQLVQNYAAKVVCKKRKYESASECLMTLHWLPVKQRIVFKVATLVYKALNNQAPDYIKNLFKLKTIDRTLRSNSYYKMLEIPNVKKINICHASTERRRPKKNGIGCQI